MTSDKKEPEILVHAPSVPRSSLYFICVTLFFVAADKRKSYTEISSLPLPLPRLSLCRSCSVLCRKAIAMLITRSLHHLIVFATVLSSLLPNHINTRTHTFFATRQSLSLLHPLYSPFCACLYRCVTLFYYYD